MSVAATESKVKTGKNRGVVAGFFPTARIAQDAGAVTRVRDIGRGPDMIEPPPLVCGIPIRRAVGPPTVKPSIGNILSCYVNPTAGLLRVGKMFDFDRGVADHLQQLL